MKAKYIGKVSLVSGNNTFVPGMEYEVSQKVLDVFGGIFEVIKVAKVVEPTEEQPVKEKPVVKRSTKAKG